MLAGVVPANDGLGRKIDKDTLFLMSDCVVDMVMIG
jgi:hypothetical protein